MVVLWCKYIVYLQKSQCISQKLWENNKDFNILTHNPEVVGSSPSPATRRKPSENSGGFTFLCYQILLYGVYLL